MCLRSGHKLVCKSRVQSTSSLKDHIALHGMVFDKIPSAHPVLQLQSVKTVKTLRLSCKCVKPLMSNPEDSVLWIVIL